MGIQNIKINKIKTLQLTQTKCPRKNFVLKNSGRAGHGGSWNLDVTRMQMFANLSPLYLTENSNYLI